MEGYQVDVWRLINQGALATYPLILFSVVGMTVIVERLWALRNVIHTTVDLALAVSRPLADGNLPGALEVCRLAEPGPAQRVFKRLLENRVGRSPEQLAGVAEGGQYEEIQALSSSLWVLGTIGSSAPFIGLFGTVVGIIKAFQSMAVSGAGGFTVVAAGISEALIATALGLAVAIVSLLFYNYFQSRMERIEATLRVHSTRLVEAVVNGGGRGSDHAG